MILRPRSGQEVFIKIVKGNSRKAREFEISNLVDTLMHWFHRTKHFIIKWELGKAKYRKAATGVCLTCLHSAAWTFHLWHCGHLTCPRQFYFAHLQLCLTSRTYFLSLAFFFSQDPEKTFGNPTLLFTGKHPWTSGSICIVCEDLWIDVLDFSAGISRVLAMYWARKVSMWGGGIDKAHFLCLSTSWVKKYKDFGKSCESCDSTQSTFLEQGKRMIIMVTVLMFS